MRATLTKSANAQASNTGSMSEALIETVVKGILENFPEASQFCALRCTRWKYDKWNYKFEDEETGRAYEMHKAALLKAFHLIFTDKWPKGCTPPLSPYITDPQRWDDWLCQCDAIDFDAFAQLACLGEVIYG